MDSDKEVCSVDSSGKAIDGNEILEPYVGMEFVSEDAARKFYIDYARRIGFIVRIMQRRCSGVDDKKPRSSAREGCKATILVKLEKSGKWVVTRFVKDHNHPLVNTAQGISVPDDKDKKIEELMVELQHQEQLCAAYRQQLLNFLSNIEEQAEQLSSKVQIVVTNIRKLESGLRKIFTPPR
ncbi:hypothetical protein Ancab_039711 [Ancistrocladus abbreviatus]